MIKSKTFLCSACKSVKVPLYRKHSGSQMTEGLLLQKSQKSVTHFPVDLEGEWKESKCVTVPDEQIFA